jgi:hypothetical protein
MARETVEYIIPTDLDDIPDGTTYKKMSATEQTKLSGIEDSATADQTGLEVQSLITGLADGDRVLVGSEPESGEKKVYGIHINVSGNIETDQDTTAEP